MPMSGPYWISMGSRPSGSKPHPAGSAEGRRAVSCRALKFTSEFLFEQGSIDQIDSDYAPVVNDGPVRASPGGMRLSHLREHVAGFAGRR